MATGDERTACKRLLGQLDRSARPDPKGAHRWPGSSAPSTAKKHRRAVLERAKGYYGNKSRSLPRRQRAGHALAAVRLPRPPGPQGRVPPALDPAHQRRLPPARHELQPLHQRPASRPGSRSTARSSPTWPSPTPPPSPPWSRRPPPRGRRGRLSPTPLRRRPPGAARDRAPGSPPWSTACAPPPGRPGRRLAPACSRAPCWPARPSRPAAVGIGGTRGRRRRLRDGRRDRAFVAACRRGPVWPWSRWRPAWPSAWPPRSRPGPCCAWSADSRTPRPTCWRPPGSPWCSWAWPTRATWARSPARPRRPARRSSWCAATAPPTRGARRPCGLRPARCCGCRSCARRRGGRAGRARRGRARARRRRGPRGRRAERVDLARGRVALVVGSEAHGLPGPVVDTLDAAGHRADGRRHRIVERGDGRDGPVLRGGTPAARDRDALTSGQRSGRRRRPDGRVKGP